MTLEHWGYQSRANESSSDAGEYYRRYARQPSEKSVTPSDCLTSVALNKMRAKKGISLALFCEKQREKSRHKNERRREEKKGQRRETYRFIYLHRNRRRRLRQDRSDKVRGNDRVKALLHRVHHHALHRVPAAKLLRVRQRRLHVAPSLPINGNTNRLPSANTVNRSNLIRVHFHRRLRGVHDIANLALRGKRRRADTAGFRNRSLNPNGPRTGNVARGQRPFQLLRDFTLHANLANQRRVGQLQAVQRVGQRRNGRLRRRILRRVLHRPFGETRLGELDFARDRVHDVRGRQRPGRAVGAFNRRRDRLFFFLKRERRASAKVSVFFFEKQRRERERKATDSLLPFSRANILFWKNRREESISLSRSFSLSLGKKQKTRLNETERKRTPPEIGFASRENLFSYDKAPVNKSVVVMMCVIRERKRVSRKDRRRRRSKKKKEKERERDRALSPRAHEGKPKKELAYL